MCETMLDASRICWAVKLIYLRLQLSMCSLCDKYNLNAMRDSWNKLFAFVIWKVLSGDLNG